jgi:4-hydroxy-L-threonine phosphate dehydrogenase PdxA
MPVRIGITLGDPAGIGPEIIDKALASPELRYRADLQIIGSRGGTRPGYPDSHSAKAALAAMEEAARLATSGEIDAIVTGPIHKARMAEIGFGYPGQTEFFADRSGTTNYVMLLSADLITIALVSTHIPLRAVPGVLKIS